jgi:uncharacterized membrane protein
MDGETFRSRLLTLLQRSRQAHRLYSSMERMQRGDAAEFTEMQAAAWRSINAELIKQLTSFLDAPHSKQLSNQVVLLRDRFLSEFRSNESEVHQRQKELIGSSEKGDFVRAAVLSRSLVGLKARVQAAHAAFSELDELVGAQRGGRKDAPRGVELAGGNEAAGQEAEAAGAGVMEAGEATSEKSSSKRTKTGSALAQQLEIERSAAVIGNEEPQRVASSASHGGVGRGGRNGYGTSSAVMSSSVREPGSALLPVRGKVIPLRKRS